MGVLVQLEHPLIWRRRNERISRKDAIKAWNKRVAEVVHCKECKWRGREECAMFYECDCGEQHTWETDDDFCSYGERVEQE